MTKKVKKKFSDRRNRKPPEKKLNLFEMHINRKKHDVLGMKSKAERGLPGISRTKSIKKRKGTLLQEYKLKDKRNVFYDRRIGEKNSAMTAEDKIMARFTAERMKIHSKKSLYNLGDDEELTHRGQTLSEIEKFDDPKSEDEDDDEENGRLDPGFVGDAHFGGGIFQKVEGEPKSRKDLIDQLIAESIKRKAEKHKIRQQTYDLTEKLDSDWKELLPLVTVTKKTKFDPEPENKKDDKFANYDVWSKKLKFEARGKPSDRLKSEEEIAKEEKEKLEQLEKERIQRMLGDSMSNTNAMKHRSADDIDDGFDLGNEPEPILAYENGILSTKKDGEQSHSDSDSDNEENCKSNHENEENLENEDSKEENSNDEGSNEDEDEDDEEDKDDDNFSDLKESDDSDDEAANKSTSETAKLSTEKETSESKVSRLDTENKVFEKIYDKKEEIENGDKQNNEYANKIQMEMESARKELPFTFTIPKEYEHFEALMKKYNSDYQSVIIERMIKCHHPSLKEANKEDLDILFTYLLQHIQDCASDDEKMKNCFKTLDALAPWLFDLMQWNTPTCSTGVMEVIKEKYNDFHNNCKTYPSLDTLIFLKLVSLLFPTSDFRHRVVTPTLIFMSEIVFRSKIESSIDVSSGLFVTTLIYEYCSLSKRFCPEAVNFLYCVLRLAHPKDSKLEIRLPLQSKTFDSFNLIISDNTREIKSDRLSTNELIHSRSDDEFKVSALSLALKLLSAFCDFWTEGQFAIFIFESFIPLLDAEVLGVSLKKQIEEVVEKIMKFKNEKLKMLNWQKKRPKPLRLYEPNIEEVHSFKKRQPMGKKKAERAKLLHKYKRELKGALREIRRDRSFLSKLKYKETVRNDMERQRKVQEILSSAAEQQGELRRIQRKKK